MNCMNVQTCIVLLKKKLFINEINIIYNSYEHASTSDITCNLPSDQSCVLKIQQTVNVQVTALVVWGVNKQQTANVQVTSLVIIQGY